MSTHEHRHPITRRQFAALKAHEALAHAYEDFCTLIKVPGYIPDMLTYALRSEDKCSVCLAGAAMVNTCGVEDITTVSSTVLVQLRGISHAALSGPGFRRFPNRWHRYIQNAIEHLKAHPDWHFRDFDIQNPRCDVAPLCELYSNALFSTR